MTTPKTLLLLSLLATLSACSSAPQTRHLYPGPPRDLADIAVLQLSDSAFIAAIDDQQPQTLFQKSDLENTRRFLLLPGQHTLTVSAFRSRRSALVSAEPRAFTFTAEKGHAYLLEATIQPPKWQLRLYEMPGHKPVPITPARSTAEIPYHDLLVGNPYTAEAMSHLLDNDQQP